MQLVRTILGDIAPERLGVVNAHDHLIRVGAGEVYIDPDHQLADVDKAVDLGGGVELPLPTTRLRPGR